MEKLKSKVEELLGCEITEEQFKEALTFAKNKQKYIYHKEGRKVVLEDWYLAILTKEYVISLAFQNFTMDLCRELHNMEKEHLFKEQGTPMINHIVTPSAL